MEETTGIVPGEVTLATLAQGAAGELFQAEFDALVRNIADLNTDPEATRKITLEVVVKPHETREHATVLVRCHSKLAPNKPATSVFHVGRIDARPVAVEYNPRQAGLFDKSAPGPRVVPLNSNAQGGGGK